MAASGNDGSVSNGDRLKWFTVECEKITNEKVQVRAASAREAVAKVVPALQAFALRASSVAEGREGDPVEVIGQCIACEKVLLEGDDYVSGDEYECRPCYEQSLREGVCSFCPCKGLTTFGEEGDGYCSEECLAAVEGDGGLVERGASFTARANPCAHPKREAARG